MSETPKSRMFGFAALSTRAKSRLGYAHVLAFLVVALVFSVWCETATAQAVVVRGRFILNIGAGFTQDQIDAFTRSIEYWADLSPTGPEFSYSVALGDLGAPDPVTGGYVIAASSRTGVTFNNNAALPPLDQRFSDIANTQLKQLPGSTQYSWEDVLLHEMAHPMGFWPDVVGNPATGALAGFASEINHYTTLLRDRHGTWAAPGLQFTTPGTLSYFDPSDVTFWGEESMAIFGDVWAGGTDTAVPMFSGTMGGSSLAHVDERIALQYWSSQRDGRPFFSAVELAIFNDAADANMTDKIDIKNFFGQSFYQTHTGTIIVDNGGNPFDLSGRFGVGLHLVADGNTVILDTDIITRGYAGAGIRIENNDNTVIINEGVRVTANGESGVGVLITNTDVDSGQYRGSFLNQGRIDATGSGGTGVYIDNLVGTNLGARFDNSGIINAGAGNNAINIVGTGTIGFFGYYPSPGTAINFMRGTTITGSVRSDTYSWQALTFGKLAGADGFATLASDPGDFVIMIDGGLIGRYDFETWGGHTIIAQDLYIPTSWMWIGYGTERSTLELRGDADFAGSGLVHVLPQGTLVAAGSATGGGTTFNVGQVQVYSGGVISPSVSTRDLGRLTISGTDYIYYGSKLQMDNGSTLRVDLGANNNSDRIIATPSGIVDPDNPISTVSIGAITINLTTMFTGTFTLISTGTGELSYSPASVAATTIHANSIPIDLVNLYGRKGATTSVANVDDTSLQLSVNIFNTGRPGNYHLTWTGLIDGRTWDINNTENWRDDAAFSMWFENGDAVTFGLSGTNTINITPDGVRVGDMLVIGDGDWIFNGDITGIPTLITDISNGSTTMSAGGLIMDGAGSMTLNGINSFVGDIMLNGGTKVVDTITFSRTIVDGSSHELATAKDIYVGNTGYASLELINGGNAAAANVYVGGNRVLGQDGTGLLAGSGTVQASNVYVYETGTLYAGDTPNDFGTLNIIGNLHMDDHSTLWINLGVDGQSSSVDVLGTANIGAIDINLSSLFVDGTFFTGAFTLISSQGLTYQNDSANLWFNGREIPLTIGRWSVLDAQTTNTGTELQLTLDGELNNYYLYWTGYADGTSWDLTTANWWGYNPDNIDEIDNYFVDGDSVIFSDYFSEYPGGTHVINISGTEAIVADMYVYGNGNWTFNGNILGSARAEHTSIVGATGMLILESYNDPYYGTFGTLSVTLNGYNVFEGGALINGGSLFLNGDSVFGGVGTIVYSGDVFVGDGGTSGSIAGDIYLYSGDSKVTFDRSDDSLYEDNISGAGSLTKRGTGTLFLSGEHTYTGLTLIENGTLLFGDVPAFIGDIRVEMAGRLGGIGAAANVTEITSGGAIHNNGGEIVYIKSLTAESVRNAGTMGQIGTMTVHNRFTNEGVFGQFDLLTADSVENTGIIAGYTDVTDIGISEMHVTKELANRSGGVMANLKELTAGSVNNRGGVIAYVDNFVIDGELRNLTTGGLQGYVSGIGNLEAGSVHNDGNMEAIGSMNIIDGLVNMGSIVDTGSVSIGGNMFNNGLMTDINESISVGGNLVNNALFANTPKLTINGDFTNTGYFLNAKEIEAQNFENQFTAVFGGTQKIDLNGGTFVNNRGFIIVGEAGFSATAEPHLISPMNLEIVGDLVSVGGAFVIGVKGMNNSLIDVSGTAIISSGIVHIVVDEDTNCVPDHNYVFLVANNLIVQSDLLIGSVNDPLLKTVVNNDDTQYWFSLARTFLYSGEGTTANQRAMGRYLDQVGIYPNGDYRKVLMALDRTRWGLAEEAQTVRASGNEFPEPAVDPVHFALDQMGGAIYGTMTTASFQNTVMFHSSLSNVLRRESNNIGAMVGPYYRGQEPDHPPLNLLDGRGRYIPSDNLWGMIYGHAGTMYADGNAEKYRQGFSGLMAGFDRINDRRLRMGLFLTAGQGSLSSDLLDRMVSKELMIGHYLRQDTDNTYVLLQAGLGTHLYDTKRRITLGNPYDPENFIDRTAKNKHNAFLATAHFETGLKYRGGILNLSPFVGLQYTGLVREGFTENGADSLNLTAELEDYHSFRTMFGMRFDSSPFRLRRGVASFYGNVAWMYEFEANRRHTEFTARFSDAGLLSGTPQFTVHGNDPGRDWVQTGFGLNYDLDPNLRTFVGYDAYANTNQVMHSVNFGFIWQR